MLAKLKKVSLVVVLLVSLLLMGTTFALAKTKVSFWTWAADVQADTLKAMVAEFNETQGEVEVELVLNPEVHEKLMVAIAGGMAPDMYATSYGLTGSWVTKGALLPLDTYLAMEDINLEDFPAAVLKGCQVDGLLYSLPYYADFRVLFYNKAVFEEAGLDPNSPPKDWDELLQYSDAMTEKDAEGNIVKMGFGAWYDQSWGLWQFLQLAGGQQFDDDFKTCTFASEEGLAAFRFRIDLINRYGYDASWAWQMQLVGGAEDVFCKGELGMCFSGPWRLGDFEKNAPELYEKNLGIAALPPMPGKESRSLSSGGAISIVKGSKHPDAAWKFIKWFTDPAQSLTFCNAIGTTPARKSVAESPAFATDNPYLKRFGELATEMVIVPWIDPPAGNYWGGWWDAENEVLKEGKDVEQALVEGAARVQAELDEYWAAKE